MGFLNIDSLLTEYSSELMCGSIERLKTFDVYHCLRKATLSSILKAQNILTAMPDAYEKWLKFCDGGLLFDTVLLSSKEHDADLDLDFDTLDDYNSDEAKSAMFLPEGYSIFAVRSYGDPICFSTNKDDEKIYLWNVETRVFEEIWNTFEDWLADEIDTAIQLIADESLEPLNIKLGEE